MSAGTSFQKSRRALIVAIVGTALLHWIPAQADPARDAQIQQQVDAAESCALWGVGVPAGAGAAFAIVTAPGGKSHVPTWQVATLAGLFGTAALWGVSMGYYCSGRPVYATLSGLGRTALLAGAIAFDRGMDCDQCDGFPAAVLLAVAGVVAWDVWDYFTLESSVRQRATQVGHASHAPYLLAGANSQIIFGVATRY